ncbi:hypothetical protein HPB47_007461 [Ixodes persulcatus]|uniref:Uncharacterized protein n=1 Tax=Ixodes persulcatus TaxID=34615 RepID=A0AC60P8B1_IXOPE|nr:hypothetical protein HPB47_007461 [Ixodes persulcatus]
MKKSFDIFTLRFGKFPRHAYFLAVFGLRETQTCVGCVWTDDKADDKTRDSGRREILLTLGEKQAGIGGQCRRGRGGSEEKVESSNWSSSFKDLLYTYDHVARECHSTRLETALVRIPAERGPSERRRASVVAVSGTPDDGPDPVSSTPSRLATSWRRRGQVLAQRGSLCEGRQLDLGDASPDKAPFCNFHHLFATLDTYVDKKK